MALTIADRRRRANCRAAHVAIERDPAPGHERAWALTFLN